MKRSHSYNSELYFSLSNSPIRIAIVGAGRAGEFHVESLSINKQFKLSYIIDLDEGKAIEHRRMVLRLEQGAQHLLPRLLPVDPVAISRALQE